MFILAYPEERRGQEQPTSDNRPEGRGNPQEQPRAGTGRRSEQGNITEGTEDDQRVATEVSEAVADPNGGLCVQQADEIRTGRNAANDGGADVAHADNTRPQRHGGLQECTGELSAWACCRTHEDEWLTRSGVCRISHGVPKRVDRLKCLGNAVVPQVVQVIGEMIMAFESRT